MRLTERSRKLIQHAYLRERLDWIVQCFTYPPTQYRLYRRRFLQVRRPNQQYQSTEGRSYKGKPKKLHNKIHKYEIVHAKGLNGSGTAAAVPPAVGDL